jgi:hypothetical protein
MKLTTPQMFNYSVHKSYLIEGNLKTNGNSKSFMIPDSSFESLSRLWEQEEQNRSM